MAGDGIRSIELKVAGPHALSSTHNPAIIDHFVFATIGCRLAFARFSCFPGCRHEKMAEQPDRTRRR
jgi:hypothetical protein